MPAQMPVRPNKLSRCAVHKLQSSLTPLLNLTSHVYGREQMSTLA